MTRMFFEADANPQLLAGKRVAVMGYGSQGKAHANNLRDSKIDVTVGLREGGKSWKEAEADGFKPQSFTEAAKGADIIMILTPDLAQADLWRNHVQANIKDGATLMFAHGFNIHFGLIKPPSTINVAMVAPKSPGKLVRRQYEEGAGVPCLIAVHQDASGNARDIALSYAHAIGGTRAGVIETTFKEETETDLFGEQAVLCGGATELVTAGFDTLVAAGYQPEVAYFECLHELKLIVDLLYEGGLKRMHQFVSDTAKWGDLISGPRVIDDAAKARMKDILTDIQDGTFARNWVAENETGGKKYAELMARDLAHPIEKTGAELRKHMNWLPKDDAPRTHSGGTAAARAVSSPRDFELF